MNKKRVKIDWSNMAGFGPIAWDRDNEPLNIHTPHEEVHHHAEHTHKGTKGNEPKRHSK